MGNMTTLQILQGVHDWVLDKIGEETANFITETVNDLLYYYTKSETYTKAEVQQIVDAIKQFTYEVVQVLPTASASTMNKIYLVPAPKSEDKNVKEEYITIQDGSTYSWEMLGTTSIDLSNYYTKGQTDSAISSALSNALASYTTTADLTTLLAQKQDVIQDLSDIRAGASAGSTAVQPSTLNNAVKDVVAESGVYDVSANNDNTKFESLSALLSSANLNTLIPTDIRKGGMSIKFVQSSDNNYVQYRYMSPSTAVADFTNVANWQGVDDEPTAGSDNLIKSGGVAEEIGALIVAGNNNVSTSSTTDIISVTNINSIPSGSVLKIETTGIGTKETDAASYVYMYFNGTSTRHYVAGTQDYILEENITKIRFAVAADKVRINGGNVSVSVYLRGIKQDIQEIQQDIEQIEESVDLLESNLATTDSIAKDADGVVLGSNSIIISQSPAENLFILNISGISIPAGKKIRIEVTGIGTTISSYMYSYNGGSYVQNNIQSKLDIVLDVSVSSFILAIAPNAFISAGTVSAKVSTYGVSTGMTEDIEDLQDSEKQFYADEYKSFGATLGSYNDNPKAYDNTDASALIALRNVNIPTGGFIRVTTDGIGTAVNRLSYVINGGTAVNIDSSVKEIEITATITSFLLYVTSGNIIDITKTVSVSVEYIGLRQEIDAIKTNVNALNNDSIKTLGAKIYTYSGNPIPSSQGDYINTSNLNYPAGKIRLTVNGVGTAISKYSYNVNGTNHTAITDQYIELDLASLTSLRIWTAPAYVLDASKTVAINVDYIGLADRLNAQYLNQDFTTDDIVNVYATNVANKVFAQSFNFSIKKSGHSNQNMIVSSYAKFTNNTDDNVPTINFVYKNGSNVTIYTSPAYTIGKKDEFAQKEWRVPAFPDNCTLNVTVTVPSNVTLYINEFSNRYSNAVCRVVAGIRMNAHTSLYGNFNNLNAFELSAKVGYPCCIAVPKRTSDGVWVCFHDDANIGTSLLDENHQTLTEPEYSASISDLTFARLNQLTYKATNSEYLKVPTLEDFFMVCAKTGMHPMFSWHPISTTERMQEVKTMAIKFGLLPYLNIKMAFSGTPTDVDYMTWAYSVFGDAIESYTGDVNADTAVSDIITAFDSVNIDKTKVRVGLEFLNSRVTVEKVQATLAAGYFAAIAWMTANPTGEQMEYWIKNGVTEFTEYNNYSNGLNW